MRKLYVIGIGAGNPDYVTMQAVKALNKVDVFFFLDKGEAKDDLVRLRKEICERYIEGHAYRIVEAVDPVRDPAIEDYKLRVEGWHEQRVLLYEGMLRQELGEDECGAFLVWGDPSLYDSTLRIVDQITTRKNISFLYEVIPGITSVQALAAGHRIPLHGIGESIHITTGRALEEGLPPGAENVLIMLDGKLSFRGLAEEDLYIYWGAYLGMESEVLVSGTLKDVTARIEGIRAEARQSKGWIMDTYLLRRQAPS
jgi:precorrin-6A synthase